MGAVMRSQKTQRVLNAVRGITQVWRVSELEWDASDTSTRTAIEEAALAELLAETGIEDGTVLDAYPNLEVVELNTDVVQDGTHDDGGIAKGYADITVQFVPRADAGRSFVFREESGLVQEVTNFDTFGFPAFVAYPTFSDEVQVAPLGKFIPTVAKIAEGLLQLADKNAFIGSWQGRVNRQAWNGGAAFRYLCTECNVVEWDRSTDPVTSKVQFRFDYRDDGWLQDAWYDVGNGRPPADGVAGVAYRTFLTQKTRRYQELFPDGQ